MRFANSYSIVALLVCANLLFSCGSKKEKSSGATTSSDPIVSATSGCGPAHQMAGKKAVWERSQCAEADTLWVDQATTDNKGVPLGSRNVSHGMMSVKYHRLLNRNFTMNATFGVFFKAVGASVETKNGSVAGTADWQFLSTKQSDWVLLSKLVATRRDGACNGYCQEEDYHGWEIQFFDLEEVVQFDCSWSLSAIPSLGKVACVVTKSPSGNKYSFWTVMNGPYYSILRLGVGKQANDSPGHFGYPGTVSDFKVTIFE